MAWWQHEQKADSLTEHQAGHQLYRRLSASLGSPPERILFRTYCERYGREGGQELPALLPQVYLHYDPLTRKQRQILDKTDRLNRECMDFLLMLTGGVRVILEVDGSQHYSVNGKRVPDAWLEAMNPTVIVLGEAPSEYLHYYPGWNTITQNLAGDIAFDCVTGRVDVYVSSKTYFADHLYVADVSAHHLGCYVGSFDV